jgi:hypothetical protein
VPPIAGPVMPMVEAVPLRLPLKLGSSGRLAWLPFCPDDGRVGPSYFLRVTDREVFVGQRGMARIHITFHKDGVAHITAPDHATAGAWGFSGPAKTPSEWSSLGQFHPGWSRLLHVVHFKARVTGTAACWSVPVRFWSADFDLGLSPTSVRELP